MLIRQLVRLHQPLDVLHLGWHFLPLIRVHSAGLRRHQSGDFPFRPQQIEEKRHRLGFAAVFLQQHRQQVAGPPIAAARQLGAQQRDRFVIQLRRSQRASRGFRRTRVKTGFSRQQAQLAHPFQRFALAQIRLRQRTADAVVHIEWQRVL